MGNGVGDGGGEAAMTERARQCILSNIQLSYVVIGKKIASLSNHEHV
jgi:hypothetical protein